MKQHHEFGAQFGKLQVALMADHCRRDLLEFLHENVGKWNVEVVLMCLQIVPLKDAQEVCEQRGLYRELVYLLRMTSHRITSHHILDSFEITITVSFSFFQQCRSITFELITNRVAY